MSIRTHVCRRAVVASALGLAIPATGFAQCPTVDKVGEALQKLAKGQNIEVRKVSPTPVKGLCEVQIVENKRGGGVLYTDSAAGYFFINGFLVDGKSGKNLTADSAGPLNESIQAEIEASSVISHDDMKKIDALVAMTEGTKGPAVYFVTDPM